MVVIVIAPLSPINIGAIILQRTSYYDRKTKGDGQPELVTQFSKI